MSTPFASIIREHKKNVQNRRQELDGQKAEVAAAIEACTTSTLTNIAQANITIANAQRAMEAEAANLALMSDNFYRRATTWSGSYMALNEAIKQLGDVVQWTQVVEADMQYIAKALDNAAEIHNKANANPDEVIPTAPPMKSSRSTDLTSTSQQTDNKDSGQAKSAETTPEKDAAK